MDRICKAIALEMKRAPPVHEEFWPPKQDEPKLGMMSFSLTSEPRDQKESDI